MGKSVAAKQTPNTSSPSPPSPVVPGVEPNSPPAPIHPLEQQKLELEAEKLRQEIKNLRDSRTWAWTALRGVKVSEWVTALAAVGVVVAGLTSGLFSATRERLEIDKTRLEQRKEVLEAEVSLKVGELKAVRAKLAPYEEEAKGLTELKTLQHRGVDIRYHTRSDLDEVKVSLGTMSGLFYFGDGPPQPQRVPLVLDAIRAVHKLRMVRGLRLRDLVLTAEDVAAAGATPGVTDLRLEYNKIDDAAIQHLKTASPLKRLSLRGNVITKMSGLPMLDTVELLDLTDNPLGDDALAHLPARFPKLRTLFLEGTRVTDAGVVHLLNVPGLAHLGVSRTGVSSDGILRLADHRLINSLWASKAQLTPDTVERVRVKKPVLHVSDKGEAVAQAFDLW